MPSFIVSLDVTFLSNRDVTNVLIPFGYNRFYHSEGLNVNVSVHRA